MIKNLGKKENSLDINEGMKSLKIINAMYKSGKNKRLTEIDKVMDLYLGSKK